MFAFESHFRLFRNEDLVDERLDPLEDEESLDPLRFADNTSE
jgi:hypothetical protein